MNVSTKSAERLQIDLVGFRDDVQKIIRRGRLTLDLMRKEGYDNPALNRQEDLINAELRDLRIRTTTGFQEVLTRIIKENQG